MREVAAAEQELGQEATVLMLKLMLQSAEERCSVAESLWRSHEADSRRQAEEITRLLDRLSRAYDRIGELVEAEADHLSGYRPGCSYCASD